MKTISTLAATLGAAVLLASAPALASAADSQSGPIQIDNVQFQSQSLAAHQASPPASMTVAFTNNGPTAASDVQFALESNEGYILKYINDVGSFAPGVRIKHDYADNEFADNGQQVAVAKVTFADGTVWTNPEIPAQASSIVDHSGSNEGLSF